MSTNLPKLSTKMICMRAKNRKTNNLVQIFGKRLAELRKGKQLSQHEFAEQIGMSRSMVSFYEAKAKNPSIDVLEKLADFFEVSPTFFIADETKKSRPNGRLDEQVERIKKLSPHKQRMVLNTIEAMLNSN